MDLGKVRAAGDPLLDEALDGFEQRGDLNVNVTVAGVEVSSKSKNHGILLLALVKLDPVFSRAGWGYRKRQGFGRNTLVFSPPLERRPRRGGS